MPTLKQASIEVIKKLPDTCSMEEIMYQLQLTAQVIEGLKDDEKGDAISTEQLLQKIEGWKRK
jgi:predicted transcriptional regulator